MTFKAIHDDEGALHQMPLWVAMGRCQNFSPLRKFGFNPSVGTSEESIWDQQGRYVWQPSASQISISSDDANDTAVGTGLRTCEVFGLSGSHGEISEVVVLDGQNAVLTTQSFLRTFRIRGLTAGASETNEGTIYAGTGTVTAGVPANIYARISPGEGQTLMAIYTVPDGKEAIIRDLTVSSFGNANIFATVRLRVRNEGGIFRTIDKFTLSRGALPAPRSYSGLIAARSDIEVTAEASGAGGIDVSAAFETVLHQIG